jgi:hypothetical protein
MPVIDKVVEVAAEGDNIGVIREGSQRWRRPPGDGH